MFGLLGKTLKHSFSKQIHELLGQEYQLIETDNLTSFFATKEIHGLNVTIPYKKDVVAYCDVIDPLVGRTNSCNTIVKKQGMLYAYNTDYTGFIESLRFYQVSLKNKVVAIIGNGATSRTVTAVAEDLGAKTILIFARHPKANQEALASIIDHRSIHVIVNTTPVGMYPNIDDSLPFQLADIPQLQTVIDVVYNPLQTNLLLAAKEAGLQHINGLYMLVSQAVKSYALFHDKSIEHQRILSLYRTIRKQQTNIVFIGMPKSGKSLYSKIYSEKYNRTYYDTDKLFESKFGMSIASYFDIHSEQQFRLEEQKIIKEVSQYSGVVISTGGGAILSKENINYLQQNGLLIFIDAPISLLQKTGDLISRPLLQNKGALESLYNKRHQKYLEAADIVFKKESLHTTTNISALEVLIYEYFGT